MNNTLVPRIVVATSIIVGLIAFDAWRHRRTLVRFASFARAYEAPDASDPYPPRPLASLGDL